jgi:hypothetical protein
LPLCLFLVVCAGMYFEIIGEITDSEIIWYEAHGIGRKRFKIKRFLD